MHPTQILIFNAQPQYFTIEPFCAKLVVGLHLPNFSMLVIAIEAPSCMQLSGVLWIVRFCYIHEI
jgi:hypothetical protein